MYYSDSRPFCFKGCGKHKDEVMKDVPVADRCVCPRD